MRAAPISRALIAFVLPLLVAASATAAGYDLASAAARPRPAVATDGIGFLAAWIEQISSNEYALVASRFTRLGGPIDIVGIRLGRASPESRVGVAFGGGSYLVVWNDGPSVVGASVTPSGAATQPFTIANNGRDPALAWNGSDFFVVWMGLRTLPTIGSVLRIFGSAVKVPGVVGSARQVSPEPDPSLAALGRYVTDLDPQIVWNGQQYVVAWRGDFLIVNCVTLCVPPPPALLEVAHVAADGTPLDSSSTALIPYSEYAAVFGVHLASDGTTVLVSADTNFRIETFLLQGDLPPARRTFFQWYAFGYYDSWSRNGSDVIFDGASYVIAWRPRDGTRNWLGTARVPANVSDSAFSRQAIPIGERSNYADPTPAMAGSARSGTAIVVGEGTRLRVYFAGEIPDALPPPLPPRNVLALSNGRSVQITWGGGEGAEGFIVEREGSNGFFTAGVFSGGAIRTATLNYNLTEALRIRAYNAAGLSEPSPPVVAEQPRRRSARH
jgi:hypothetical protein